MSIKMWYLAVVLGASLALPLTAPAEELRYAWADVVEAQPVHQQVRIPVRRDVCWDEQVYQAVPARRSATPKIFGAILGGVIGNQFGGGSGRDLMTVAGAALGASVAADEQHRKYPDRYYESVEQRCETRTEYTYEDRIVSWDVTYEFNGELYQTRLREAPSDRIRVEVGVRPVEG